MNNITLQILSTLAMLGLGFIFIGMPIWGIVALCQSRKRRLAVHN
ncbi:MAG: hypothetical protein ACRD5K_16340 [Candidatus Acidiferrales bacterium]